MVREKRILSHQAAGKITGPRAFNAPASYSDTRKGLILNVFATPASPRKHRAVGDAPSCWIVRMAKMFDFSRLRATRPSTEMPPCVLTGQC